MSGNVKDQGAAQSEGTSPGLTAADLDRLAHEWSERRVVFNGVEFRAKQDAARTERLVNALPSLLALARRGLEAERFPAHCAFCGARSEATPRAAAEHIATCDKHPLKAAVEENALLRAEIARGLGTRCDAPDCALQPLVGLCWDHAVTPEAPFAAGESKLAAALAEVERLRGRLDVRPEVAAFALAMEDRLRANDHKGGWKACHHRELLPRLLDEVAEVVALYNGKGRGEVWSLKRMIEAVSEAMTEAFHPSMSDDKRDVTQRPTARNRQMGLSPLLHEAADVANFAMMLADLNGDLPPAAEKAAQAHGGEGRANA